MGLVNFSQLLEDPEWLQGAKIPMHSDSGKQFLTKMMNSTNTMFVDLAFLLTSGRDMHFGSAYPFIYDYSDNDANRVHKEKLADREQAALDPEEYRKRKANEAKKPKLAYLPISMNDLADYMVEFISKNFKNRPSMSNMVFGVDNHVHVPITKVREWHYRDYGTNGSYETSRGEFKDQLRAPFSRSDEAFVSNLINLIHTGNFSEFNQQVLGMTFTRNSPRLDDMLTDRYIRPYFVSLLFTLVYDKLEIASIAKDIKFEQEATVYVMHPLFNFATLGTGDVQFFPNVWHFESNQIIDKNVSDDGLYIGEADIQLLWFLETKLINMPVVVEVLSDDTDNVMLMMTYYIRHLDYFGNLNMAARLFLWTSDERCLRMKYMFEHTIPKTMAAKSLSYNPKDKENFTIIDNILNCNKLFVELCMAFFKNDYYDNIQGVSATVPKFNYVVNTLSELFLRHESYLRSDRRCFSFDLEESRIIFDHLNLQSLRYMIALTLLLKPEYKSDSKSKKEEKQIHNNFLRNLLEKVVTDKKYLGDNDLLVKQLNAFIEELKLPNAVKDVLSKQTKDIAENVLYETQIVAHIQNVCAAYAENDTSYDVFGEDTPGLDICEPTKESIYFMRFYDEVEKVNFRNRMIREKEKKAQFVNRSIGSDKEIDAVKNCLDVEYIENAVSKVGGIFFGELNDKMLSRFASMFEWVLTYWTVGHFPCFSKQHSTDKMIENSDEDIKISRNTILNTVQGAPLLLGAGYLIDYVQVNDDKFLLTKLLRLPAGFSSNRAKRSLIIIKINNDVGNGRNIDSNIYDMGACLKRSGMLLMAPIDIPEDVRMHKEEQQILMALYNLVRTELFRILKIDASENGKEGAWIDLFYSAMRQAAILYTDQQTGEQKVLFPDEQLALKKTAFMMFYDAENNESRPYEEPPFTFFVTTDDEAKRFVLMVPTVNINRLDCAIDLEIQQREAFGEYQKGSSIIKHAAYRTQRKQVYACERDILGEFDTVFFSGLILTTDKEYKPEYGLDQTLGQLVRGSLSFPYYKMISQKHATVGSFVGPAMQNLMAQARANGVKDGINVANGFVFTQNGADDQRNILSHNLDVNIYALPLIKYSITKDAWEDAMQNLLSLFRRPMEAAFYAFINWKLHQSAYLRYCQALGLRNKNAQHWRGHNYYIIKVMALGYPNDSELPKITIRDIKLNRVENAKEIIAGDKAVPMHACWPMAYIQYNGKADLVEDAKNALLLRTQMDFDNELLLRVVTIYFPSCMNLFVCIDNHRDASGNTTTGDLPEVRLLFKGWPDHLMYHYLFYCYYRVYSVLVKPLNKSMTFEKYLQGPFIFITTEKRPKGFAIVVYSSN